MQEHPQTARLHLHYPALPLLAVVLLVLQLLLPSRVWVILLVFLGGGWLAGWLWARSLARRLVFRRELRHAWLQVGDRLVEHFTLYNRGLASALWLEVVDGSTLPGFQASRVTSVGFLSQTEWSVACDLTRRGLYTFGPTRLVTGDPLGLYTVTLSRPDTAALVVLPPVVPLPGIEVAPGARVGDGRRAARLALERSAAAGWVREYLPGDQARWIHWPSTVRRGRLFVREFDHRPAGDWWIVLDLNGPVQAGAGERSSLEHGVLLAASLAGQGLRERRQVGLAACGQELALLPPGGGAGQRVDILRALALAAAGDCPLDRLLDGLAGSLQRGASLVLVTPAVEGDWLAALLRLADRGAVPTVLLVDPAAYGDGSRPASGTLAELARQGVAARLLTGELLDRLDARLTGRESGRQRRGASRAASFPGERASSNTEGAARGR
jgi:uncharacterized protein (DUF58 family)